MSPKLSFCPSCGGPIQYAVPLGDNRERAVCHQCSTIHYQNPRIVVGTIPQFRDQVLLCRRAIEPRRGFWTLPAGFMENGESTDQGAIRETLEEAGAQVIISDLFAMIDVPHVEQVHVFFIAQMTGPEFSAGEESLEVKFFSESEIPWDELAFATVAKTLRWYFADRTSGKFGLHRSTLHYQPRPK